ncbi:BTAD domain-containing putative transcriptional regulator [Kitasatospora sp. NPDC052896]|uniref:AfsR/SARP family transcriptional regulator n=1 Tax=Kitasatospora sp. NPDC052896 TaxID=3364061 RepID=UPI0037CC13A7
MRIQLLGPVSLRHDDGTPVALSAPKRRALLAALALELGSVVPTARLLDTVWEGSPPPTARAALQGHVAGLRRLLAGGVTLATRDPGYVLLGEPEQVDAVRFEQLHAQARTAGDERAAALLAEALRLWRGPALADCGSTTLREAVGPRLAEARLAALEQLAERLLRLGRAAEVVPSLTEAVESHPGHEPLVAQLLLCLDQLGRRDDALTVYRRARERLRAEPGPRLLAAHRRLWPAGTEPREVSQLPRAGRRFVGRTRELAELDRVVEGCRPAPVLVSGPAGVGKTSLVLRWAHGVADRFPDGRLYVDLRGFDETDPLDPAEVLMGLLCELGVADRAVPEGLDERARLYRALLADRRVLVVLDNARTYEQLAPLLPDGPRSATVVTSRSRLGDLVVREDAVPLTLSVLSRPEALDLLAKVVGPARLAAEPRAAEQIVELCDRLPLALRVAAARLAARPGWALADLAAEISDEQARLATLSTGGSLGVAAALSLTCRALPEPAVRLFTLLGLYPGREVDPYTGAALAGVPLVEARALLGRLDEAHMVQETAPGLFARHDLVRLYAAQLVAELTCAERESAMDRLIDHYLAATALACVGLETRTRLHTPPRPPAGGTPPLAGAGPAIGWFRREESTLRRLVERAEQCGRTEQAWQLAHQVCVLYYNEGRMKREWEFTARCGLRAAEACGDPGDQARLHADVALALMEQGRHQDAGGHLGRAVALAESADDPALRHHCRTRYANCLVGAGEPVSALPMLRQILDEAVESANRRRTAQAHNNLANALVLAGSPDLALDHAREAVRLLSASTADPILVLATQTEAEALHALGRAQAALAAGRRAMALGHAQGNLRIEAYCREFIGAVLQSLGRIGEAVEERRLAGELADRQHVVEPAG